MVALEKIPWLTGAIKRFRGVDVWPGASPLRQGSVESLGSEVRVLGAHGALIQ